METGHPQNTGIGTLPDCFFQTGGIDTLLFYLHFHAIQQKFILTDITSGRTRREKNKQAQNQKYLIWDVLLQLPKMLLFLQLQT